MSQRRMLILAVIVAAGLLAVGLYAVQPKRTVIPLSEMEDPEYSYDRECEKAAREKYREAVAAGTCTWEIRNFKQLEFGSTGDCVVTCK